MDATAPRKLSREQALAAWDEVFLTRPAWLDGVTIEGILWHVERARVAAAAAVIPTTPPAP